MMSKIWRGFKEKGLRFIVCRAYDYLYFYLRCDYFYGSLMVSYHKLLFSKRTVTFRGKGYKCFYHRYNRTWENERCFEVPVFLDLVQQHLGEPVLEVGNVLSHYAHVKHDVLDKYEIAKGVINEDVVDFKSDKEYDLIISISTLEHVGWDTAEGEKKEPEKILRAIENLKRLLSPNGKIVVTVPVGFNPFLDEFLRSKKIKFDETYYMKRICDNQWKEVNWQDIENAKYGFPVKGTNGLIIGVLKT